MIQLLTNQINNEDSNMKSCDPDYWTCDPEDSNCEPSLCSPETQADEWEFPEDN